MRVILFFLRWCIWLVPLLILYGGFRLLTGCLTLLMSPGVPLTLRYQASGGVATVLVDEYRYLPSLGQLSVKGIRVTDPSGGLVVQAGLVRIANIGPTDLLNPSPRIYVRSAVAEITRKSSGKFNVEDILPPYKGKGPAVPIDVIADDCRINLTDLSMQYPLRQVLWLDHARVANLDKEWLGMAQVRLDKAVPVRFKFAGNSDNLILATEFKNFVVPSSLVAWGFKQRNDLVGVQLGSILLNGPVSVRLRNGKTLTALSEVGVQVRGIITRQISASTASWTGVVTESGARGQLAVNLGSGGEVAFVGGADFPSGHVPGQILGRVRAAVPSEQNIPPDIRASLNRTLGSRSVAFKNFGFDGWVSAALDKKPQVFGEVTVDRLETQGVTASSARVSVRSSGSNLLIGPAQVQMSGGLVSLVGQVGIPSGPAVGALVAKNFDLAQLATLPGFPKGLTTTGHADVLAYGSGSLQRPSGWISAIGQGQLAAQNRHVVVDNFDIKARLASGAITLERGSVIAGKSEITLSGGAKMNGPLDLKIQARGFDASLVDPSISGPFNLLLTGQGTVAKPEILGRLEGYGLAYKERIIPAVTADFFANSQALRVTHFSALKGAAHVEGKFWYRWEDQRVAADITGARVRLGDFLGDTYVGGVKIESAAVGGTLKNPTFHAKVSGQNWVIRGVKVDRIAAEVVGDRHQVVLTQLTGDGIEGQFSATGNYAVERSVGTANFKAEHLALSDLAPELTDQLAIEGHLSGQGNAILMADGSASGEANGTVSEVALSGTALGAGPWNVHLKDKVLSGSAEIGQLDAYARIPTFRLDLPTRIASASFDIYNFNLDDLSKLAKDPISHLSIENREAINDVSGRVSGSGLVTYADPLIMLDLESFSGTGLRYRDVPVGDLDARLTTGSRRATIHKLTITGPAGNLQASGAVDLDGAVSLDAEIERLDLANLRVVVPELAGARGTLTASVLVRGIAKSPEIQATAEAEGLTTTKVGFPSSPQDNLSVFVTDLSLNKQTGLSVDGSVSYHGFSAEFTSRMPTVQPLNFPDNPAIQAQIKFKPRTLTEIIGSERDSPWVSFLVPAASDGQLSGIFTADGTLRDPHLNGSVDFTSKQIALSALDDRLHDLALGVHLKDSTVDFSASATGDRGGDFSLGFNSDIKQVLNKITSGSPDLVSLGDLSLKGQARLRGLKFRQNLPEKKFIEGAVSGDIDLSGRLPSPLIKGNLSIFGLNADVPAIDPGVKAGAELAIDPQFDFKVNLGSPAHLRAATVDLSVVGEGTLAGKASQPVARAEMEVENGTIRLPSTRIRVEPGGSMTLNYRSVPNDSVLSLTLDLIGSTSLTTVAYGDTVGRFDVTVGITGDMFQPSGLSLAASSDPPGLSQDRILALLGSTDVLEAIGGTANRNAAQDKIRNAVAGFAIPMLFEPLTAEFARSLGFQYLNLDYNTTDLASLSFARTLSSEFFVQGRRQLSQSRPDLPLQYDLRLVYRPRRVKGFLKRLSLSFGTDQDRPWKFSINYGVRF